jgi:predicted O-methyltransferase YrrM
MYDEFKQVGIDYDSDAEAEKYDRETMQSRNLKEELEFIKQAIAIKNTHVVLELGTGNRTIALLHEGRRRRCVEKDDTHCHEESHPQKCLRRRIRLFGILDHRRPRESL